MSNSSLVAEPMEICCLCLYALHNSIFAIVLEKGKTKFQDSGLSKEFYRMLIKGWLEAVSDIYSAKCLTTVK